MLDDGTSWSWASSSWEDMSSLPADPQEAVLTGSVLIEMLWTESDVSHLGPSRTRIGWQCSNHCNAFGRSSPFAAASRIAYSWRMENSSASRRLRSSSSTASRAASIFSKRRRRASRRVSCFIIRFPAASISSSSVRATQSSNRSALILCYKSRYKANNMRDAIDPTSRNRRENIPRPRPHATQRPHK